MSTIIIGLAGFRQVGKSHVADHLVANHGFKKVHPFYGGKVATAAFYRHIGIDADTAWRMVDGDLKDAPCEKLPGGVTSRFFMEKFGKFMGVELGPEWTVGQELRLLRERGTGDRYLIESLVYEDMVVRSNGGVIVRVDRPGVDPTPGLETDVYTERMLVDHVLVNDKPTLQALYKDVDIFIEELLPQLEPCEVSP